MKTTQERWELAQRAEEHYWSKWKPYPEDRKATIKDYWDHYLTLVKKQIAPQSRILDIGCGPDGMINYVDGGERYGLDPLMDYYLSNFEMPKNIKWRTGVGESIPFEREYFDLVITTNTLDHTKQPLKMLEEINRVLVKDGLLFLAVDCYGPFSTLRKMILEKLGKGDVYHPYCFTLWDIRKLLEKSKFYTRIEGKGIGHLGKYLEKSTHKQKKRPRFKANFRKKMRSLIKRVMSSIDKILGYRTKDFYFIASKR